MQRIQRDDQTAFQQLYESFFYQLYQFAYSYVQSKEIAEEVVHDVFLRLWQQRETLETIENISVYLYVSVRNAACNSLRKKKTGLLIPIDELPQQQLQLSINPESVLINRELQARIREAVAQLPTRCKLVFKLIKEDGLSYKEVAAILDISVKTVDTQLYLALKKLSFALHSVWQDYTAKPTPPSKSSAGSSLPKKKLFQP
ncbi:RNA polymerase sigma-70 factor [Chitinophaga sp. MM2321]|uniref:RNA polymerase sigma factor n=1 Tax=Chitinophaga sp. MM2321 TaxID=3137178 RepID=UPI0032D57596